MKQARLIEGNIQVKFAFPKGDNRFGETLQQIKSIEGRRFDATNKCWWVDFAKENIHILDSFGFSISEALFDQLETSKKPIIKIGTIKGLKKKLYPFQQEGVEYIEAHNGRTIIADEMGLGKTIQAIAWLQHHHEYSPAIVVCPSSMKYIWQSEIAKWSNRKSHIVSGRNGRLPKSDDIVIINYDILANRLEELINKKPKIVILDEAQYIKSAKTIRTKAVFELCKEVKHIIALSGTPITSRPAEFYNVLKVLRPEEYNNRWRFAKRYCALKKGRFGWDMSGASNTSELHEKLKNTVMIRRKKKDVVKELPAKTRSVVPIDINNRGEYEEVSKDVLAWIHKNEGLAAAEKASGAEVLVKMEKLKQVVVKGKLDIACKWIQDFLDSNEKLVLFATHTYTLDFLQTKFKKVCVRIDGSTSPKARNWYVDNFQNNDKIRLFIGNIKAAGVGITLTAASNTCFLELGWTPSEHIQAEDRVHRIGQKDSVEAYYLVGKNTIEEKIMKTLERKSRVLDSILDGKSIKQDSIYSELIKSLL